MPIPTPRSAGVSPATDHPSTHIRRAFVLALALVALLAAALLGRPAAGAAWTPGPLPFGRTWLPRATYPAVGQDVHFSDPARNRLFLGDGIGEQLRVIDAADGHQLAGIPYPVGYMTFAGDGQHLYAATYHNPPRILVIDADTLAVLRTFIYHCSPEFDYCEARLLAAPANGRLYIARTYEFLIDIINPADGQVINTLQIPGNPSVNSPGLSGMAANDTTLYVSNDFVDGEQNHAALYAYDLSQPDAPALIDQIDLDAAADSLRLSPDGSTLITYIEGHMIQMSTAPLAITRVYGEGDDEYYYTVGFDTAGLILATRYNPGIGESIVVIDPADGAFVRALGAVDAVPQYDNLQGVLPLAGGQIATLHNELVIVRRPVDHVAAVPVVMNSACFGGVIYDNFTDPTSGWPRRNDAELITDYTAEGYLIGFRDAGAWAGVSRGDVWHNGDLVEVIGELLTGFYPPQNGSYGIVFGLNDDWSDFYSLEIVPGRTRWYLFHFHDGAWEELRSEEDPWLGALGPQVVGIDRDSNTGIAWLEIDGERVMPMPNVSGRVGLAAGSFWPGTQANFNDYRFHGDNCEPGRRGPAALDVSPPLPPRVLSDE